MGNKVVVIGAGFAGLSAATHLASKGYDVTILEKNDQPGGRARSFSVKGYTFDMGPSWYWMPDVFDHYFETFGKKVRDYYNLQRLDPSYRVFFGEDRVLDIPASVGKLSQLFETIEPGSASKLEQFLCESAYKYHVGINDLVYKSGLSLSEFADKRMLKGAMQMDLLKSIRSYIHSYFKNEMIRKIMEFPILFLGGTPQNTPALYSLMNYADMALGTWYPMGGMHRIVEAMVALAREKGVSIRTGEAVSSIEVTGKTATTVSTATGTSYKTEYVVAAADYHHVEQQLLPEHLRHYSEKYWQSRKMAPSSLLFYLGINKKLRNLRHHTLFFDEDFDDHAREIYDTPEWPQKPLFYVSCTSQTDASVAPRGCENLFLLMPVAPGLADQIEIREKYYHLMMDRLEKLTGQKIREFVEVKESYAHSDFVSDYNAFKGNAYGLANTLWQTAFLKPSMKSKNIDNLYYAGQLTVPGPGVPPALISGEVAANEIEKASLKAVVL